MINFRCEACGTTYIRTDAVASHDPKGTITISIKPCQNCRSFVAGTSEDSGRLKEQMRIGKILNVCFGEFDKCTDFDRCPFHDACLEYTDGNLPNIN